MTNGERPKPQYGEYADETGQHPQQGAADTGEGAPAGPGAAPAASAPPAASASPQATPVAPVAPATTSTPLPGVPHNLGVDPNRSAARSVARPAAPAPGEPYRAAPPPGVQPAPPAAQQPSAQQPAPPAALAANAEQGAQSGAASDRRHPVDRIVTILLLVLGAFGALNLGFSMLELSSNVRMAANILAIEDFVVPQSVSTIGTIGAVIVLTLFALMLIYSIQRLRARKLTFWVPLTAGAIALIVVFALTMIAYAQSPELVQAMAQPDALERVFAYAAETP